MIRILIIDDHPIVRTGIRSLLAQAPDLEVVGEAADGDEAVTRTLELAPDVVTLDVSLPGKSGFEVLEELRSRTPRTAVLVLSMHPEEHYAPRFLRAGASGYLAKEAPPQALIGAVRTVARGGRYVSEEIAEKLAFRLDPGFRDPPHEKLSRRELEVMRLLAAGRTVSEIGRDLAISVKTVSTYRRRILDKMDMSSSAEIIRYALESRLVE